MIENVFFLCDQKRCHRCHYPDCKHTICIDNSKTYKSNAGAIHVDIHDPVKFKAIRRDETITDYWEKEK